MVVYLLGINGDRCALFVRHRSEIEGKMGLRQWCITQVEKVSV